MIGFRHTHPAMREMEDQYPEYGLNQREHAKKSLTHFNKLLSNAKYIAGQRFTYADIQMGVSLQFLVRLNKIEISEYPYLNDYIAMLNTRPSFSAS